MFALTAGLLFSRSTEQWLRAPKPEFWDHIFCELEPQFPMQQTAIACCLFLGFDDGTSMPEDLLFGLKPWQDKYPFIRIIQICKLAAGLDGELRHAQLILLVTNELEPQSLLARRLRLATAQHVTICIDFKTEYDGVRMPLRRHKGSKRLASDSTYHPINAIQPYLERFRRWEDQQRIAPPLSQSVDKPLTTWALGCSTELLKISNRKLLIKTILLGLIVVVERLFIAKLAAALVLLAVGAIWLAHQPLRRRSLQWWCLGQGLWVQDLWHLFKLKKDGRGQQSHFKDQPLDSSSDGGMLLLLFQAHHLYLWLLFSQDLTWSRFDLANTITSITQHKEQAQQAYQGRGLEQRLLISCGLLAAAIIVLGLVWEMALLLDLALLLTAVTAFFLLLHRPLPLVSRQRLGRYTEVLADALPPLNSALRAEQFDDPNLMGLTRGQIDMVGGQTLDLVDDALEATPWSWG